MFKSVTLSRERLLGLLTETIEQFVKYRDHHGLSEEEAQAATIVEVQQGMDEYKLMIDEGHRCHHEAYHDEPVHNLTFKPLFEGIYS